MTHKGIFWSSIAFSSHGGGREVEVAGGHGGSNRWFLRGYLGWCGFYVKAGGPGVSQREEAFPKVGLRKQTSAAPWLREGKEEGGISSMASG